jgi:predicted unusual protein kinase regulating ubiquinone biosynthesis (AarF/ABC1/UbiB family)
MKGLPYLRQLQLHRLLSNNKHLLIEQVDFKKEIENINLFRESNQNLDWIKIPKVHTELSDGIPSIIVMEYIEGIKYKQLNNDSDSDKEMFARLMLRFCMVSMLYNSAVHCDLHAGNLIFIKNDIEDIEDLDDEKPEYVLGIIDFGLSFFPSRENQNIYYNFLKDVLINKELSTTFIDTDLIQPKHIKDKSTYFLKSLIIEELNAELKIHQDDMNPEMMINWNTILNKYNLFFSDEGNKLLLSLFVSSETTKSLSTDWTSIMADEFNKLNAINKLIEI